jgi:hypothetical protein
MMDIQLAQDLFDLGIEIPGVQFIDPDDGIGQLVGVFRIAGGLIGLDGVDDRMIVIENIVQNGFFFVEDRLLFEEATVTSLWIQTVPLSACLCRKGSGAG